MTDWEKEKENVMRYRENNNSKRKRKRGGEVNEKMEEKVRREKGNRTKWKKIE